MTLSRGSLMVADTWEMVGERLGEGGTRPVLCAKTAGGSD